jgi:hypothetical protein
LLQRSNNVAITAVIASVAAAYPVQAGEAAYALLTCGPLLKADHERSIQEPFNLAQSSALRLGSIDPEKGIYEKERDESARLPHRRRSLEYVAVILQMTEAFQQRVWSLIDRYRAELPPESEQDDQTKLWRIQLHRIDTRTFVETGRTDDGQVIIGSSEPEPDLQQFIQAETPRFAGLDTAMELLAWGQLILTGRQRDSADREKWHEQLAAAQSLVASGYGLGSDHPAATGGPAYVAAVCVRDHWSEMSPDEQDWCAITVCDAVEADSDTTDYLSIVACNPMEGSRPAAFAVSALFDKSLRPEAQARLLPALSKAVLHAVDETVSYAVQGIALFLWRSDRALALTCIQALVTQAVEKEAFSEKQRQVPFAERQPEEDQKIILRSQLREFIIAHGAADERQIAELNLGRWPGRAVSKYLFAIVAYQPNDPLVQKLMGRCIAALPVIWETNQRSRRMRPNQPGHEERYDPHFEHDLVEIACRYVLSLAPTDAIGLITPVFEAAARFPEKAADVVNWLILQQGDRTPAPTLWILWQRFADDFVSAVDANRVDEEHSEEAKLLRELFLGVNWQDQRDWLPLHGETQRLRAFFEQLPPMERGFEFYAYYLAKAGTPTLPHALNEVAGKLREAGDSPPLNEIAIFYLEEILTRMIYGGNSRVRAEQVLRQATLSILDSLVVAGSSRAYKLRDDFLTPLP